LRRSRTPQAAPRPQQGLRRGDGGRRETHHAGPRQRAIRLSPQAQHLSRLLREMLPQLAKKIAVTVSDARHEEVQRCAERLANLR